MLDQLRISTVIAVHNGATYLSEALESALGQTVPPLELIIVDDGSTDETPTLLKGYAKQHPNCTVLRQPQQGPGAARNTGIDACSGDLINFVDADDRCPPHRNEALLEVFHSQPDTGIAVGQIVEFISPDLPPEVASRFEASPDPKPGHVVAGVLLRAELFQQLGRFDQQLQVAEFMDWYLRAKEAGILIRETSSVVLERRIHGENFSIRNAHLREKEFTSVLRSHIKRRERS